MLSITIPACEMWDEKNREFLYCREQALQLEHSLVSLSKWEAKWCKPFLSDDRKSNEEIIDYIRCMTITQNVDPRIYDSLSDEALSDIQRYIDAPMTATTFLIDPSEQGNGSTITAEIIYYWMVSFRIPFECQKWHLNRLLTLIKVCERKNRPPKKRKQKDIYARNARLNARNRARFKSRG